MKFLIILLITFSSFAMYQPHESVGSCDNLYVQHKDCDKAFDKCISLTVDCNYGTLTATTVQVNDFTKPINSKSETELCVEDKISIETCSAVLDDTNTATINEALTSDENCQVLLNSKLCESGYSAQAIGSELSCLKSKDQDCQDKLSAKSCTDLQESPIKRLDTHEVYCSRVTGFNQKDQVNYSTEIDSEEKNDYDAKQIELAGMKMAQERIDHGKKVISLMVYRNAIKSGLTETQIEAMVNTYSGIKALLETGSLNTAKTKITGLVPDEILVTTEDKNRLISKINEFPNL